MHDFGMPFAALMTAMYHGRRGPPDEPPEPSPFSLRQIVDVAHIGTTVTIAIFLWNNHQASVAEASATASRIAVLQAQVSQLQADNAAQDRSVHEMIESLARRVDVQRTDIGSLQQDVIQHLQNDARQFDSLRHK